MHIIENCVSRDPKVLYNWIVEMNDASHEFSYLDDDGDKRKEVKVLCLLFAERKLSFHDFMWHVLDLDLFERTQLGPVFANFEFSDEEVPFPTEAYNQITSTKRWADVFQ